MVEVRLHGSLAAQYGKVWHFDVASPAEAFRALSVACRGFRQKVRELDKQGLVFRVRTKTHDYCNEDVEMKLGGASRLDIIPIVRGASAGVRFVAGAVIAAVGFVYQQPWAMSLGMSLMIGSVVEWLTPVQTKEDNKLQNLKSWTFNGAINNADQGLPVPVIYGEVLAGGTPISAGLAAAQVTPNEAVGSDVFIGGQLEHTGSAQMGQTATIEFPLSAGPFNLDEPYTYSWSYTGFALAATVQLVNTTKSTVTVILTYTNVSTWIYDSGQITVQMTGYKPSSIGGAAPQQVNVSDTVTVKANVGLYEPPGGN
jgi:predicted phage tail protein